MAVKSAPLSNVIALTKQTGILLWKNWLIFAGITGIYGALSLLLVRGLSTGVDVAALRGKSGELSAFGQLISNSGSGASQTAAVYQSVLFIIISLAVIWALRQLYAGEKFTLRDVFYRGMYPLIPFILVLFVVILQLIPMVVGSSLYQLVVSRGIVSSVIEITIWGVGALALVMVSLYFLAASIFALYIVTLPGTTPLQALRSARKLVRGRRWTVLRKLLFLPLAIGVVISVVTVPFIFVIPVVAQWVLFVLALAAMVAAHTYIYSLYRELIND